MFRPFRHRASTWYTHYDATRDHEYGATDDGVAESFEMTEGRQRYWNQVRELQDTLGISHVEARRRWNQYYNYGGAKKRVLKRIALSVKASTTDLATCPFCRDSIYHPDEGGPDFICPNCQAHYHLDCFEDELGGRCATLGCSTRRVISQARTRIRARGPGRAVPQEPIERPQEPVRVHETSDQENVAQAPRESVLRAVVTHVADNLPAYAVLFLILAASLLYFVVS